MLSMYLTKLPSGQVVKCGEVSEQSVDFMTMLKIPELILDCPNAMASALFILIVRPLE